MNDQLTGGYEWRIPHNGELLQAYMEREEESYNFAFQDWVTKQPKRPFSPNEKHKAMARHLMNLDNAGLKVSSMSHNCKFAVYLPYGVLRSELVQYLERKYIHPWKILIPTSGNIFRVYWR